MQTVNLSINVPVRYAHQILDRLEVVLRELNAIQAADKWSNAPKQEPKPEQPHSKEKVQEARKSANGAAQTASGIVTQVDPQYKTGKTRNGDAWQLGLIEIQEEGKEWPTKATTFEEDLQTLLGGVQVGQTVTIQYEQGQKGKKLTNIMVSPEDDLPF